MATQPPTLNQLLDLPPDADVYTRAAAVRRHEDVEALVYIACAQGLYANPESARAVLGRLLTLTDVSDPRQLTPGYEHGYAVTYDHILLGYVWAASDAEPLWAAYERFLRDEGYHLPLDVEGGLYETEGQRHAA